ncbi:MAG: peptidoglycan-binding protein [Rhodobacteraceae bacterium]|jgi:peptidoglycan hydrolase-like protein with peptidoglycan-binding domain|nr:peptidoglycan-binding protein [Paracoccaceae bacterium]
MRRTLGLWLAGLLAGPAAADVALLVGNGDYGRAGSVRGAAEVVAAEASLRAAGFEVIAVRDGRASDLSAALQRFAAAAQGDERVIAVLAGRFAHSATDTWLLPLDAGGSGLGAMGQALPVSAVLAVLSAAPGQAVLVLGGAEAGAALAPFLRDGIGAVAAPQGVAVVTGAPAAASGLVRDTLARPGGDVVAAVARDRALRLSGYAPRRLVLVPAGTAQPAPAPAPAPVPAPTVEQDYWRATRDLDTAAAYDSYLRRYPAGAFAAEARARLAALAAPPATLAETAEAALALSRDARRAIQRDLSLLGHNTRGIDGIFGPGTRAAITQWQQANGIVPATGFLTAEHVARIAAQAELRAAQLEAEAEARRQEQERLDRAFWDETGARGDEAGLRAYLRRFPDGLFAELAAERIAVFDADRAAQAAGQDRAAWDAARGANTVEAYRGYLQAFPQGTFAEQARARIDALTAAPAQSAAEAQAAAAEAALGLNAVTRRLVESRLDALDLRPGLVDGVFDDDTRRGIRRYQTARALPVTGYLDQDTVVRLLADSLFR